ncbi:MAG TPA: VOC family protein [Acidimicrobiales bacterium]|jgi:PhnB protein
MANVSPFPDGYQRVTPYLIVDGAAAAIDFYTGILGGTERMRMPAPDGKVGHAEVLFGESVVMLADEFPDIGALSPKTIGGTGAFLNLYVDDVDSVYERALAAGATGLREVEDKFYGDRSGDIQDPFGHRWSLSTHVEDVSPEEMQRRMAELAAGEQS